ncbi:MAG: ABC transporter substrate-binding protein [Deinococcota bacterium]
MTRITVILKGRLTSFLAILLLGLVAYSTAQEPLVMAMSAQPETLDPHITSATSSFQVTKSLYDTLVEADQAGVLVPALADSWNISDDGLTVTFNLAEGVMFHDGSNLDSTDVAATLERLLAEETASPKAEEFQTIVSTETPDELTVVLSLSEPSPALLASLASGWGAILPSEKIAEGHDFANDPVGTGPFMLEDWVRDSNLLLTRFEDYYQGPAASEQVRLRFVTDSAVQLQGLLAGDFDVINTVASADIPMVDGEDGLELIQEPSGLVLVAAVNNRREYLANPLVRQAFNHAIDKATVLEVAYGGGTPVGTFMEAGSPWYPASITPFAYDPELASSLLAEADFPMDQVLDIVLPQPFEAHITAGQIVQDMLSEVGIQSELRVVEWGVWLSDIFRGERDFDITVIGHTGKLDPTGRLGGYGDPETNYVGYTSSDVTELLVQAAQTPDVLARESLYTDALTAMHEDAPFIYFGTPFRTYAQQVEVDGFWITPLLDTFDFHGASK